MAKIDKYAVRRLGVADGRSIEAHLNTLVDRQRPTLWVMINCDYIVDVAYSVHRRAKSIQEQREAFLELARLSVSVVVYSGDLPNLFLVYAAYSNPSVLFVIKETRDNSLISVCDYPNVRVLRETDGALYEVKLADQPERSETARHCSVTLEQATMTVSAAGIEFKGPRAAESLEFLRRHGAEVSSRV